MTDGVPNAMQWTALFRSGDASPVDAAHVCFRRIEDADREIGAFVTVTPEVAIEAARASEARWRAGEPLSSVDGVPVAMKDLSATAGVRTTFGSLLYRDFVPTDDVAYWALLKRAGAVLIGKTNTPEFGSLPTTENLIGQPTRNPADPTRTAGGSSGGAAAAVAAGMVPLAEGSDAAGSIRIPASCCGVVGIKPSRGRVSEGPGFPEHLAGLATSGPMAATVDDAFAMLQAMSGADAGDPYPAAITSPARPVRLVGLVEESPHAPVHPEVRAAVARVASEIEAVGIPVEPVGLPLEGIAGAVVTAFSVGTAATPFRDEGQLTPVVRGMVEHASRLSAVDYERARVRLHRYSRRLRLAMDPYDAVLLPVLPEPPQPLGFLDGVTDLTDVLAHIPYTYPFNVSGQPAVAIPAAETEDGLPVGAQLVGRFGEDEVVIAMAARWEAARRRA